jgi:hypothetical protein
MLGPLQDNGGPTFTHLRVFTSNQLLIFSLILISIAVLYAGLKLYVGHFGDQTLNLGNLIFQGINGSDQYLKHLLDRFGQAFWKAITLLQDRLILGFASRRPELLVHEASLSALPSPPDQRMPCCGRVTAFDGPQACGKGLHVV